VSLYETYDKTCVHYDAMRVPVGADIILGCLTRCPAPLHEMHVLDAGCGTGAYSAAMLDHVGHVDAVDLSDGMLRIAREKLKSAMQQGRIALHRADVCALPFPAEHFHAVCFNQVLHHLDAEGCSEFPVLRSVLSEAHRVLRRGGVLVIGTCSQQQLAEAHWYLHLIPEACRRLRRRYAPLDALEEMLAAAGFTFHDRIVPLDAVILGAPYFDVEGPLKPSWRDGDSVWSLATPKQLERAEAKIRDLSGRGELQHYFDHLDAPRRRLGQVTFCYASRA
jgi:ubiquinone/menaquinone biosynthesis C-methylase UbiE